MAIREIIFRGKRVDNGEWAYGYLVEALDCVTDKNETFIIEQDATYFTHGEFACAVEVITETVGQFTGLCDKNGRKIFEGDIVKVTTGVRGYKSTYGRETYTVSYKSYECVSVFFPFTSSDTIETEVIGNIYDNKGEE